MSISTRSTIVHPNKDCWATPPELFDRLNRLYGPFILDVCANATNHKCKRWYGPGGEHEDALTVEWPTTGWLWMNPPYSRGNQRKFVEKAIEESKRGCKTLALLPANTSTWLFHELIYRRFDVEFLPTRVKFVGAPSSPKFANMLVRFER
jgi:phage N-6-adenine-methyltransferase